MDKKLCASFLSLLSEPADTFHLERTLIKRGYPCVAGLDEAGRGPLAGPVVAGCVVLPVECDYRCFKDSKKLSPARRQSLFETLYSMNAGIGVAVVSAEEIDRVNILQASLQAMTRAISDMAERRQSGLPDFLLVDGTFNVPVDLPQQTLIKGESKSASIAAASIIAKVTRDALMAGYHERYPMYNFFRNKGYPTAEHRLAIKQYGPCPLHRRTFKGVREFFDHGHNGQAGRQPGLW